jgi:outer membrane protein
VWFCTSGPTIFFFSHSTFHLRYGNGRGHTNNPCNYPKRMKTYYYIIILFFSSTAYGQQQWGLKDCIAYGLKNNRSNNIYANDKNEATAKAHEALAGYLPSISVTSELDDNLKLQESVIPAGIFGPNALKIALTQKYNTTAVAQVNQTIYDQSLLTGLKANKFNGQQADLNIRQNEETIIYNVSKAYYQIYIYREQLSLLKINLETYSRQMRISALKVKKGVVLQSDLDKVTVNYNNTLSQVSVAESNLIASENQLKNEMGYPLKTHLLVDSIAPFVNKDKLAATDSTAFSPQNRTDYQLSKVNEQLLEINQKSIRDEAYPKLTAYAKYGTVGFGNSLSPALNDLNSFSSIGLKLSIPLFDFYKRNARYKEAEYERLNAQEQTKIDEDNFRLEYENARTKLDKAQSDMDNNCRNIVLARSVFSTTDLQFQKGVTDLTDWLNAQSSLKEAQNNYLTSLYNFCLAKIDLEQANGTLQNFYNTL